MNIIVWPTGLMYETAQTIASENENLLNEHTQRWQKIQEANGTLPMSMQGTFSTFHTTLKTHLLGALTLHRHMGQTLAQSAELVDTTEAAIAKTFKANE